MENWEIQLRGILDDVSSKLQEAERLLKENGINCPSDNYSFEDKEKIQLPYGYIRTTQHFRNKYYLKELLDEKVLIDNIAYSLQLTDLFHFLINRFYIGLSVGKLFVKIYIILSFSILEAILFGHIKKQHKFCVNSEGNTCKINQKCNYYIRSTHNLKFKLLLEILKKNDLLVFNSDEIDELRRMKDLRDNIHIWESKKNEFQDDLYNLRHLNKIVKMLYKIKNNLPQLAHNFETKRKQSCKML